MARLSESERVSSAATPKLDSTGSIATSPAVRTATFSAIVLFVNAVARMAYLKVLVPELATEHPSLYRLPFFDTYMALYSVLICAVVVALPSRMLQRFVHVWNLSTWRHRDIARRRLFSLIVFVVIFWPAERWLVDRWLGIRRYLEHLTQVTNPVSLTDLWDAACAGPVSPPDYMSRISYVFASALFAGLIAWLATLYYRAKRRPLIEWTRHQVPFVYYVLHVLVPAGTLLVLALFLLQVPTAYGSARAFYELKAYSESTHHRLTLVLDRESPLLANASIKCPPQTTLTPRRFCYGSERDSSPYLYLGLETDDSYHVVLANGERIERVVVMPKSVVVEVGRWQSGP